MLRKRQIVLPAIAGLGAASVVLAFFATFDEPWALRGDNKLIHFPMQLEAYRIWMDGRVPFWTDSIWMGYPLLANSVGERRARRRPAEIAPREGRGSSP